VSRPRDRILEPSVAVGPTKSTVAAWGPAALDQKNQANRDHQAKTAAARSKWIGRNRYYYESVLRLFRFLVEPQKRVLNVRCQTGFILDAVQPKRALGIEISPEMVAIANAAAPAFEYQVCFPEDFKSNETFDYVIFSDIGDTVDVQKALLSMKSACEPHTRLIIYSYNHLWEPLWSLAQRLGMKIPQTEQNWFSEQDIQGLLAITGYEWLKTYRLILFPKYIPLLSPLINRLVAKLPLINRLCMVQVLVARPRLQLPDPSSVSVSVIIPCKDERGNVQAAVERIPQLGRHTEIIFCDDKSTDGTADEVRRMQREHPGRSIKLVDGPGICKAQNVWAGFRAASGDVLMILDADLTVMPEELPYFFNAIASGDVEFVNGSRLVYPMPKAAMKATNMIGNKFFSIVFSYLLGQPVKDTLCGTKVLWRSDWDRIVSLIGSWGTEDRWGDYELLFGAAKLDLRIMDQPVHYQERVYGATKMTRVFKNGLIMLRMCYYGFLKLKLSH